MKCKSCEKEDTGRANIKTFSVGLAVLKCSFSKQTEGPTD